MDEKHWRLAIFSVGLAVLLFCVEKFVMDLPQWLFYPIMTLSICLMLYGLFPWTSKAMVALGKIEWQSPIAWHVHNPPLKVNFDSSESFDWVEERNPLFRAQTMRRKRFWVTIENIGSKDIPNVSIELERIEELRDRDGVIERLPQPLGMKLIFETNGRTKQRFSPGMRDRVFVISHIHEVILGSVFRIEGINEKVHYHDCKHQLYLRVTGSGLSVPISVEFVVWEGRDKIMEMKRV